MYNCELCGKTTEPRQTQLKLIAQHMVPFKYKEDDEEKEKLTLQIKKETPVCVDCYKEHTPEALRRK